MLHAIADLEGATPVGDSGVFLGGLADADRRCRSGENDPSDFKFFFNYVRWPAGELERDVASGRWQAFALPPELVLHQDDEVEPADLWSLVRRRRSLTIADEDSEEEEGPAVAS